VGILELVFWVLLIVGGLVVLTIGAYVKYTHWKIRRDVEWRSRQ
jgi:hypothetical protein